MIDSSDRPADERVVRCLVHPRYLLRTFDQAVVGMADTPYFSERHGRAPRDEPLDFDEVRRLVINVLDSLREQGYFQQAFGYECVDGDKNGEVGADPDAFFLRKIRREHVWPYWHIDPRTPTLLRTTWAEKWDADTLFDVVEVLHDLVSKPSKGRMHTFANCGYHASHFDRSAGRRTYREEIDDVLQLHDPSYEFGEDGRLIQRVPDEFRDLMDEEFSDDVDSDLISEKVEHAKHLFLARSSSLSDHKQAVRELADVLEALRADMKNTMLPKDESAMFHIANGFSIRHNSREQIRGYDREVWFRWMFYVYLATIHAVLHIRDSAVG